MRFAQRMEKTVEKYAQEKGRPTIFKLLAVDFSLVRALKSTNESVGSIIFETQ